MSMPKVSTVFPSFRPALRGAAWAGGAASWFFGGDPRLREGLTAWLEAMRARIAIDRAARRDARSREALLALARRYQATQPEFAKDLYAAACNERSR